jgi:hypothetical protein
MIDAPIFELADLDRLLTGGTLHVDAIHVSRAGIRVPTADYSQTVADRAGGQHTGHAFPFSSIHPQRLLSCFATGAVLRLPQLARHSRPVRAFAGDLARREEAAVDVDAVLAPASSVSRAIGVVDGDLVLRALEGSAIMTVDDRMFRVIAGDTLRAPAGSTVEVVSIEPFLCLELLIHKTRVIDLLRAAVFEICAAALTENAAARRAVSIEPKSDRFGSNDWIAETASSFRFGATADRALSRIAMERARLPWPRTDGLRQIRTAANATGESRVSIPNGLFFVLSDRGAELTLLFAEKELDFPPRARLALTWLCERREGRAGALPGLDEEECLILVRRLVREGFLVIDE